MIEPALELRGISRRFGSVQALHNVSFSAKQGSIHALLGENGAGKTTLMRIAFGMLHPDAGSIEIQGRPTRLSSPADAIAAGIGMVHQQFSLIPAMSVAENVALGGKGRFRKNEIADRISDIGRRTGLVLDPAARVSDMRSSERQKLEILRTLAHDALILILDEPTAALTPMDIGELFVQLKSFASSGGSVVLITHKLSDAIEHADEVTVLRRGNVALHAPMSAVTAESLVTAMLGSAPVSSKSQSTETKFTGRSVLSLVDVVIDDTRGVVRAPLNLDVAEGQILGVSALEGAAAPLLRVIAGRIAPISGKANIPERIGFVPENRQEEAIIPDFSLTENVALRNASIAKGLLNWNEVRQRAVRIVNDFGVTAEGSESPVRSLSGGNQQRFILGRELENQPQLLVLENPTQGLDVKAAAAIHARMRSATAVGTAIVFYSSDLDELVEIADRILIVSQSGWVFSQPDRDAVGGLLLETKTVREEHG